MVNGERQLEAVVVRCSARFAVDESDAQVEIEVALSCDEPGEGTRSIARHGCWGQPAWSFRAG